MDSPGLDEARHRRALEALRRINRLSRSAHQLFADVVPPGDTGRRIRVLDLACGGGDVAVALESAGRRRGIDIRVEGCDASPVAIATARRRARDAGSTARFFELDVLRDELPDGFDVLCTTLFLHHLDEPVAIELLRRMGAATGHRVVVQDLARSRLGYWLAVVGTRLLTTSDVARFDGPVSARAAFTREEALELAAAAGLRGAHVRSFWPQRYNLVWEKAAA